MARSLKLYRRFIAAFLKARMQYRAAFILDLVMQFVTIAANLTLYWVVFSRFKAINGWTLEQVLFMYFLGMVPFGLGHFFFNVQLSYLSGAVARGEFDIILTKPINPLFHVVSRQFDYPGFPYLASGIVGLVVMAARLHMPWTLPRLLYLVGDLVGGFLIVSAVWIVVGSCSFTMVWTSSMSEMLLFNARSFTDYPIDIYGKGIQSFLTFVVPYSFVNYFPVRGLLGRGDYSFFPKAFDCLTLAVGVVAFSAAYLLWTVSVKKYKSTGS